MVVENVVDQHTMVMADKSRIRGIIDMPTTDLDPPRAGRVKLETDNRLLVLRLEWTQRKRVLEEEGRFGKIQIK